MTNTKECIESDAELLARFHSGEACALELLLARYEGMIFRFLIGVLRDQHQAEDTLQETFVQVLRKLDTASPQTFRSWIFTIAHQQAMLLKRKAKRTPTQADERVFLRLVGDEPADFQPGIADDARYVRRLLDLLPSPQKAVIMARVFDGKSFREVAAALGCPLNTVLSRMHDGLKKLRQLWEAQHA